MARPRQTGKEKERRARGKGSITRRKDRQGFQVSRSIHGKRRYAYVDTRKQGEEILKQWEMELQQGLKFDRRIFTVAEYVEYWLDLKKPTVEQNTYIMYRERTKPVCGKIGKVKLDELTTDKIQMAMNALAEHYAPTTMRNTLGAFSVALEDAVTWDLLLRNPAKKVKLPKECEEKDEVEIITPEQVARLLNTAYEWGKKKAWALQIWALIALAVYTGLRHGELSGLRWSNVDFHKKTVVINQKVHYHAMDGKTQFWEGKPKTKKSNRTITLPEFVLSALAIHRKAQIEIRLKAGPAWQDHDFVFTNPQTGNHLTPAGILRAYRKILVAAGIPAETKLHTLRHTAASIMLKLKIPVTTVSGILGHSNPAITWQVYAHVVPGDQEESMTTYADFLALYGVRNDVNGVV